MLLSKRKLFYKGFASAEATKGHYPPRSGRSPFGNLRGTYSKNNMVVRLKGSVLLVKKFTKPERKKKNTIAKIVEIGYNTIWENPVND